MQIWTVANQKGGVGKTTTAVALAGLAQESGLRVLLVDLDPQGSMTSYFKYDPDTTQSSTFTLFVNESAISFEMVSGLLVSTQCNITLLPSSTALATLERKAIGGGMGLVIKKALQTQLNTFDLAIIDCPPQLGVLMVNALAACGQLIVPVQTEFLAIKGLERMMSTLKMLRKSRQYQLPFTIVPTMFDRRTQASNASLRAIRNGFGASVWPGKIPIDTRLRDSSRLGIPPHQCDSNSRGVTAYRSLYKVLLGLNAMEN